MPDKLQDLLGADAEEQLPGGNPLEATPDGTDGEENPLEKMDAISKAKPDGKKQGSKDLDEETINTILKTGENRNGMFIPDEEKPKDGEPDIHEEEDEDAKVKVGKKADPKGKYRDMFKNDMLKNPNDYKIQTPKGEMTVSEAIRKGYNPLTKRFEKDKDLDAIKEGELSRLNDADRARIEELTSPSNAQVAPADAEMYGLSPDSPMIRQQAPQPEAPAPAPAMPAPQGGQPAGLEALLGGGQAAPAQAEGQPDMSALLGGM